MQAAIFKSPPLHSLHSDAYIKPRLAGGLIFPVRPLCAFVSCAPLLSRGRKRKTPKHKPVHGSPSFFLSLFPFPPFFFFFFDFQRIIRTRSCTAELCASAVRCGAGLLCAGMVRATRDLLIFFIFIIPAAAVDLPGIYLPRDAGTGAGQ